MSNIIETLTTKELGKLKFIKLSKEQTLFNENDVCEYVGVVLKGLISISSFSFKGNEIIYNQLVEGDLFGNNLIFSDDPIYKGNVIAKSKSQVALISKENLIFLMQTNKEFLVQFLNKQSNFGKALNSKIKLLSFDGAEERLQYYLFINKNKIRFSTVTALANELQIKRETLSRLLSKLIKEGKIIKDKNYIKLNG